MMPALVVIGLGRRKLIPIPLPVVLLWPLVLLAFSAVWLMRIVLSVLGRPPGVLVAIEAGLGAVFVLAGLRIDLQSRDGGRLRILFI